MNNRFLNITALMLIGISLYAQPPETVYEGNLIATGFKQSILTADGPFPIGFTFTFFGNNYTEFYVSANGMVLFTDPDGTYNTEAVIPTLTTSPNNFIAPFWDNLSIVDGGNIMYYTVGASLNKKCIIQFKNMGFDPIPTPLGTFTVILYETSNTIQMQYRLITDPYSPASHGGSASIGLENADGSYGVQYAYHEGDAVHTEDAILFTPSGSTSYTVDDNALYDGVFLTTNATTPDPGIVDLISPSEDAVIGADHTFEWGAAANATSYYLVIDVSSDFSTATYYNAGTSLTYDITGLTLDETYYWAVYSSNSTALTWCEERRFSTSSSPPLTAVPREVWVSLGGETLGKLQYTGGDGSAKTATVTSLPVQGELWQVSSGVKSTQITTVPTVVTDPEYSLIYVASGTTGNGVGSFNFKFTDDTGDSPEAEITINVNPAGVPNFMNASRNTNVEVQFDLKMNDPAGKQGQFTVTVDGSPAPISSAALKTADPYTIVLALATPLAGSETVLVSYTKGDVSATTGGLLESFVDQPVILLAQTITFPTNLTKKYGDIPFNLSASSTSGLTAFTFSSSNTTVATISGALLTIKTVGSSDITAYQSGDATYAPSRYIKTLTVSKGDQTITFATLPAKTYGDSDFNLTATASSGLTVTFTGNNDAVATVTGTLVHIAGAGSVVITASQAGNTLWNPAPDVPRTLTINKAVATVTLADLTAVYDGLPKEASATTDPTGLMVNITYDGSPTAPTDAGTYEAVGTIDDTNYQGTDTETMTISKADQTITFDPLADKETGDPDFDPGATASSGLSVSYSSDNLAVATIVSDMIHIIDAGTTNITASQAGNTNYNAAVDVIQPLTVNLATGLENTAASSKSFNIYSANSMINIQSLDNEWTSQDCSVRLFNIIGNPVNDLQNVEFSRNSLIQIPAPAVKGLYVVEIKSGLKRYVGKVVVR